jgi:hypothetical protein
MTLNKFDEIESLVHGIDFMVANDKSDLFNKDAENVNTGKNAENNINKDAENNINGDAENAGKDDKSDGRETLEVFYFNNEMTEKQVTIVVEL